MVGAVAGDLTQAFIHANVGEKTIARVPKDLGGMGVERPAARS